MGTLRITPGPCRLLVACALTACGAAPAADPDAGAGDARVVPRDARAPDAPRPEEDGGVDAGSTPEAGAEDAGPEDADAGLCECPAAVSECVVASCETGLCVEAPVRDGTACGEMGLDVCVDGACVARGCGDGYREPGSSSFREGCDDGNVVDGDLCSASCEPRPEVIAYDPDRNRSMHLAPQGTSIGVDGAGRVLFVWQEDGRTPDRAMAQRATRGGVLVGAPIVIDPDVGVPPLADPRVAGLSGGGWVVVWHTYAETSFDVRYRLIAPDGTVGRVRTAHPDLEGRQYQARVAALADGFVIVWSAELLASTLDYVVRARRFGPTGSPLGPEVDVPTDTTNAQQFPAVAAAGGRWLVGWIDRTLTIGAVPTHFIRRYDGAVPLDATQVEVATGGWDLTASTLESGEFVVAWTDGDVKAQILSSDAVPPAASGYVQVTTTSVGERFPVLAPLSGRDFVAAWVEQSAYRPIRFGASDPTLLAPEAETLRMRLEAGARSEVSVAPSPDGVWFLWSGYDGVTPRPGISAFHLPLD